MQKYCKICGGVELKLKNQFYCKECKELLKNSKMLVSGSKFHILPEKANSMIKLPEAYQEVFKRLMVLSESDIQFAYIKKMSDEQLRIETIDNMKRSCISCGLTIHTLRRRCDRCRKIQEDKIEHEKRKKVAIQRKEDIKILESLGEEEKRKLMLKCAFKILDIKPTMEDSDLFKNNLKLEK